MRHPGPHPLIDPAGLRPLELPGAERAALDRRVRATDRLTQAGAEHKTRIKDLVRQLMPMSPLTGNWVQRISPCWSEVPTRTSW